MHIITKYRSVLQRLISKLYQLSKFKQLYNKPVSLQRFDKLFDIPTNIGISPPTAGVKRFSVDITSDTKLIGSGFKQACDRFAVLIKLDTYGRSPALLILDNTLKLVKRYGQMLPIKIVGSDDKRTVIAVKKRSAHA